MGVQGLGWVVKDGWVSERVNGSPKRVAGGSKSVVRVSECVAGDQDDLNKHKKSDAHVYACSG
jgi:hypothetical protein